MADGATLGDGDEPRCHPALLLVKIQGTSTATAAIPKIISQRCAVGFVGSGTVR